MKKADKMFAQLGYSKAEDKTTIVYSKQLGHLIKIVFYKGTQFIEALEKHGQKDYSTYLNVPELEAIMEKKKELKWDDDYFELFLEDEMGCKYCNGKKKYVLLSGKDEVTNELFVRDGKLEAFCGWCASKTIVKIQYCPMCGRRLKDAEN